MVPEGNREPSEGVFSPKQSVVSLHVCQLNREYVRGALQFIPGENQRRAMPLAKPPLDDWMKRFQERRVRALEDAKQIQVRVLGVELSRDCGAVQHGGLQIFRGGVLQPLHKLVEFFLQGCLRHRALSLPASAGAASSKGSSSKAAEPTATAEPPSSR